MFFLISHFLLPSHDSTIRNRGLVLGGHFNITKAIFDLKRVEGVNLLDKECRLLNKQPINYITAWNCKGQIEDEDTLLVEVNNTLSNSVGSVKFIVLKMKNTNFGIFNSRTLSMLLITLAAVLGTICFFVWRFNKIILTPVEDLKKMVCQTGVITRQSFFDARVPSELAPVYEAVYQRDEVIQQAKEELVKQNEYAAIIKISQQVAHDIRFPIMVIRNLLLNGKDKKEGFDHKLYARALGDLETLTGQLYEQSSDFKKEVGLTSLVREVIEMKKIAFANSSNKVQINFASSEEDYKVIANETKLKFVISNIINNAKESIPSSIKGNIDVSLTYNNFEYILKVKDNGRGIDSKNLTKVFDRGVSIEKPGGCGLGLSDARESIDKINGKIEISSVVGAGTTVAIHLPIVSSHIMSVGSSPYEHVFIEDYKLTQLLWIEAAREKKINFAVFSSPSEFERNIQMVAQDARIYVDSHFPDTDVRGEDWAESLFSRGYEHIWLCSTDQIKLDDKPWIMGSIPKEIPFGSVGNALNK